MNINIFFLVSTILLLLFFSLKKDSIKINKENSDKNESFANYKKEPIKTILKNSRKKINKNKNKLYNISDNKIKFKNNDNIDTKIIKNKTENSNKNLRKYDLESILERPNIMPTLNDNNKNNNNTLESENNIYSKVDTYSSGFKTAVIKTSLLRQPLLRKLNISDKEKEIENKIIDDELLKDCDDCDKKVNLEKFINKY